MVRAMKKVNSSQVQRVGIVKIAATVQTRKTRIVKPKRIACPSTFTTPKPIKRRTTRPRVGNKWRNYTFE